MVEKHQNISATSKLFSVIVVSDIPSEVKKGYQTKLWSNGRNDHHLLGYLKLCLTYDRKTT